MKKDGVAYLAELVSTCDSSIILGAISRCDGHTILDPKAFVADGLPTEVVAHLTHTHNSDGSPKGSIFVKGQPVKKLVGVYGLDLLRFIASALHVEYQTAMGRGFEARNIQLALRQHFQSASSPAASASPADRSS